jgi:hypothetical protein
MTVPYHELQKALSLLNFVYIYNIIITTIL